MKLRAHREERRIYGFERVHRDLKDELKVLAVARLGDGAREERGLEE